MQVVSTVLMIGNSWPGWFGSSMLGTGVFLSVMIRRVLRALMSVVSAVEVALISAPVVWC